MNSQSEAAIEVPRRSRVLIVEDEPLIAENLRTILVDAGFEVAGVAAKVEAALMQIADASYDVAIVDANLAGVSAAPAAAALSARGLPFIVLSGYTREQLQSEFSEGAFIQKPYRIAQLINVLNSILLKA
jgi:DNA-binding response OmpR family regulator